MVFLGISSKLNGWYETRGSEMVGKAVSLFMPALKACLNPAKVVKWEGLDCLQRLNECHGEEKSDEVWSKRILARDSFHWLPLWLLALFTTNLFPRASSVRRYFFSPAWLLKQVDKHSILMVQHCWTLGYLHHPHAPHSLKAGRIIFPWHPLKTRKIYFPWLCYCLPACAQPAEKSLEKYLPRIDSSGRILKIQSKDSSAAANSVSTTAQSSGSSSVGFAWPSIWSLYLCWTRLNCD